MGPGCTGLQPETAASPALAAPGASRPERPVPRIRIGPALPDRKSLDAEIARLRDLGVSELRSRWHTVFGGQPPPHLPRHLLFRVLAYRLQADQLGDLDAETVRLLDRSGSPEKAGQRAVSVGRRTAELSPGTMLRIRSSKWHFDVRKLDDERWRCDHHNRVGPMHSCGSSSAVG